MSTDSAAVKRKWNGEDWVRITIRAVLVVFAVIYVYPIIFAGITSFKTLPEFYTNIWAMPQKFLYRNYVDAFYTGKIGEYFFNSVSVSYTHLDVYKRQVCFKGRS